MPTLSGRSSTFRAIISSARNVSSSVRLMTALQDSPQGNYRQPANLRNMPRTRKRCWWASGGDPLYATYHDEEWGVPLHDDRKLFEMLLLEGFQAGLSWITILRKRENF